MTTSPSEGGTWARWMEHGRDVDELGQVGETQVGCRCGGRDTWEAGKVGGMWVGGTQVRRGQDMGEVGKVGGICGLCRDA